MDSATTLAGLEDFGWESGGRDQGEEKADGDGLEKHFDGRKLSVSCVCELCDCVVVCGLIMMRISGGGWAVLIHISWHVFELSPSIHWEWVVMLIWSILFTRATSIPGEGNLDIITVPSRTEFTAFQNPCSRGNQTWSTYRVMGSNVWPTYLGEKTGFHTIGTSKARDKPVGVLVF